MQVVLFTPQIPQNTGSIGRLCAATQTPLHLIEPLGFSLEDRFLKRAGLDYWPYIDLHVWPNWEAFISTLDSIEKIVLTSARCSTSLYSFFFTGEETLVFGPESKGLPSWIMKTYSQQLRIPIWGKIRSLNLANATAVCLYEAYRQGQSLIEK